MTVMPKEIPKQLPKSEVKLPQKDSPKEPTITTASAKIQAVIESDGTARDRLESLVDQENPPKAKNDNHSVNKEKGAKWIDDDKDPRFQALKRKIVENVRRISSDEFGASLEEVVSKVNNLLQEDEPYAVLWDFKPHSSRRWVYEQARDSLRKKPDEVTYQARYTNPDQFTAFMKSLTDRGIHTFTIFDDAIYSGEQIKRETIVPIFEYYKKHLPGVRPKIILGVPFVTDKFLEDIHNPVEAGYIHTTHIESMPRLREIFTEDDWNLLEERNRVIDPIPEPEPGFIQFFTGDEEVTDATLTFFDHRIADGFSFAPSARKLIDWGDGSPYRDESTGYFKKEEREFRDFERKRF